MWFHFLGNLAGTRMFIAMSVDTVIAVKRRCRLRAILNQAVLKLPPSRQFKELSDEIQLWKHKSLRSTRCADFQIR